MCWILAILDSIKKSFSNKPKEILGLESLRDDLKAALALGGRDDMFAIEAIVGFIRVATEFDRHSLKRLWEALEKKGDNRRAGFAKILFKRLHAISLMSGRVEGSITPENIYLQPSGFKKPYPLADLRKATPGSEEEITIRKKADELLNYFGETITILELILLERKK